jgi:hypothetical protein
MASSASNFEKAFFEKYGGVCRADASFNYSETLDDLNSIVPFPVYAVSNANFNAIAVTKSANRFIGIFSGLLNACYTEVFEVLSGDRVRQIVPEDAELPDEGWAAHWKKMGFDKPISSCAWCLSYCMVQFVMFHEAAHLSCGHHNIIAKYSDLDVYLEFPAFALSTEHAELRRALELDADHVAARSSLILWREICDSFGRIRIFEAIKPDEFWLTALTIFFCLAQRRGNTRPNRQSATHPTTSARLTSSITQTTHDPLVEPLLEIDAKNRPLMMEAIRHFELTDGYRIIGKEDASEVADEVAKIHETIKLHEAELVLQRDLWAAERKRPMNSGK